MTLRLTVAPRFHLAMEWGARLAAGAGVFEAGGHYFPRGPWRPLTTDELTLLISGAASGPEEDAEAVCLFQIPGHLREAWWNLLDKSVEAGDGSMPGFEEFTRQVADFLRFKQMEVPAFVRMEAVVTAAGMRSIRTDPETGGPAGLGPSVAPWAGWPLVREGDVPRLWAVVNLGEEDSSLVLIDPSTRDLMSKLALRHTCQPPPSTIGELVKRFLREFPDHPPIRLRLATGEGIRLPFGGLILDGDATAKQEPDVLLLISEEPPSP